MASTSIPAAKRRRITAANDTLRKPFRSPLISRPGPTTTPSSGSPLSAEANPARRPAPYSPSTGTPSRRRAAVRPLRVGVARRGGGDASKDNDDDDDGDEDGILAAMRVRGREADALLRAAEAELETARQAGRIEARARARRPGGGEGGGAEMGELVERWREAGRRAADELLGLIADRVAGMGGAKAWRESSRRQAEFYRGMDGEEEERKKAEARRQASAVEEEEGGRGGGYEEGVGLGEDGDVDPREYREGQEAAEDDEEKEEDAEDEKVW